MAEQNDIYVRAHTVPLETAKRDPAIRDTEPKWPQHALVFDCETRITTDQALTFGFWRFGKLRNGIYECTEEGIVHNDSELSEREFKILHEYARTTKPDTGDDGSDRLRLYCRSKFISEVLGWAIQSKALIVGFNLPFDLSRLALDWETAKNGGWSLILSQWRNPENGQLKASKYFPRIVIKALNSKTAIIHSTRAPVSEPSHKSHRATLWPAARFLDLRTLLWALRNKSYSLKTACKEFDIPGKLEHKPSGRVSREEIEYCRQDVRATFGLLNAAKKEYDLHPFDLGLDKMFSPASVAKAYLEKVNIFYPSRKIPDIEINSAYGIAMQSYFGGRAECRIRNCEVPVCPVDFMSQYPTVNELLDNWSVLTAKAVTFPDATEEIKELLSNVTREDCFNRKLWPTFNFFCAHSRGARYSPGAHHVQRNHSKYWN